MTDGFDWPDDEPALPAGEERIVVGRPFGYPPHRPWVWVDPECWARGPWQALAITLAEPLRKAVNDHYDGCQRCHQHGISRCPEGYHLWGLLPEFDKVVIA